MVMIGHITRPAAGLVFSNSHVQLQVGDKVVGKGTIYVTHETLSFQPNELLYGIAIPWTEISVHGISAQPNKRIYFMLDREFTWPAPAGNAANVANEQNGFAEHEVAPVPVPQPMPLIERDEGNETDESDDSDDAGIIADEEPATECWLIPDDENIINLIYQAMNVCQAMLANNSDSASEESFMDADDGQNDAADALPLGGGGADAAEGYMQNLNLNDERFEDADE